MVLGEHENGSIKSQSLSAVEAAKSLSDDNSVSMLLAGSGPSFNEAVKQAASSHPSISQVFDLYFYYYYYSFVFKINFVMIVSGLVLVSIIKAV